MNSICLDPSLAPGSGFVSSYSRPFPFFQHLWIGSVERWRRALYLNGAGNSGTLFLTSPHFLK